MKRLYSILVALFITINVFAQAPQKMSYQAVIRKSNNTLLVSSPVGMKISILKDSATGTVVYAETYNPNPITNANGLVSLEIGTGLPITGTFAAINWATGPYFIKTETDPTGGTAYSITGTNELMSVPYALFSANGTPGPQGPAGTNGSNGTNGVSITNTTVISDSLFITLSNGQILNAGYVTGAQGIQGSTGATGPAGTNGLNGTNGVSITNSTVVGDSLYITLSSGQTLNAGYVTGAQGLTGATGPQGPIGLTGAVGPQGIQGQTGATGPQGMQGLTGATGAQGPIGLTGATGPQGPIGATGAAGPAGPQGPIGLTGATGNNGTNGVSITNSAVFGDSLFITLNNGQILNAGHVKGNQGASGAQGPTGLTSLIATSSEMPGSNCNFGGIKIETGIDINANGNLDSAEVMSSQTKYLCNNTSSNVGLSHYIGELYGGGVVIDVWKDSANIEHGTIMALNDIGTAPWENSTSTYTSITGLYDEYYGMNNTTLAYQNGASPSSAIGLCYNYTSGGYSDWYLPARFELSNADLIPVRRTLSQNGAPLLSWNTVPPLNIIVRYWTSTVPNGIYTCYITPAVYPYGNGGWYTIPMNGSALTTETVGTSNIPYYVRPVRRF